MKSSIFLLFASLSAAADVPTWICKDAAGTKSIQDHPCEASVTVRELNAVQTPPPSLGQSLNRFAEQSRNGSAQQRCDYLLNNTRGADHRKALSECR